MVEIIIFKYILVPLIVALCLVGFALYAKVNALLKPKKLIVVLLVVAIILALPSLWGLLSYYFVPSGLIITQVTYFGLGVGFVFFMDSGLFQSIGFEKKPVIILIFLMVAMLLGAWIFYLVFEKLSGMTYSIWVPISIVWFVFPVLFHFAKEAFCSIPPVFYHPLDPLVRRAFDDNIWENEDYLQMMNITLNVKRLRKDSGYSAYPARAPAKLSVSQWFIKYLNDQQIKFPNSPIEIEEDGEPYCWIFYTTRFFIFNRPIAHDKTFEQNRIRSRSNIYVRRVSRPKPVNAPRS